jgi:hypothetical protein
VSIARRVELWLGSGVALEPTKGARYRTRDGTTGEMRNIRDPDRIRLSLAAAGLAPRLHAPGG